MIGDVLSRYMILVQYSRGVKRGAYRRTASRLGDDSLRAILLCLGCSAYIFTPIRCRAQRFYCYSISINHRRLAEGVGDPDISLIGSA